ncbi:PAS domain-containing sensor histidine kinase [bacterium]|nr:PAS domain-containing sensor histidine kinase [bacterium]MBU1064033.1 PAS domain-containing sensor histidine kinase [bacterium]MBU1633551.1 PAS domain-containing sensor histidine kinase [bacterium]MBU1874201.1 PAS domain-containing sensor histidine kinase [bacterium]
MTHTDEIKSLKAENRNLKSRIKELEKTEIELKKTERELIKNEKKFRDLVDLLPQTVYEMDLQGNFKFTNKYGIQSFGYTQEDIKKGVNFLQLFVSAERKRVRTNIQSILEGGSTIGNEYTSLRKDGTTFQSLFYTNPIMQNDEAIGLRGVVIDITDRKKAESDLKESRDQLRSLASHLQTVREEERLIMAREIHDELGQALTALKMDLIWMQKRITPEQKEQLNKVHTMSQLVDSTIQTVRRISTELRPGLIDDLGLQAAMEWYCGEFQNRTGIKCNLDLDEEEHPFEQDRVIAVFRIFQEALTNVARHADAKNVFVSLHFNSETLSMEIKDNGMGITEEQIFSQKSLGLVGLRERVNPWGGTVIISGIKNMGTTVKVILPIQDGKE